MKKKKMIFWFSVCWIYSLTLIIGGYRHFQRYLILPYTIYQKNPIFIEFGEGGAIIADKLKRSGFIEHPFLFRVGVYVLGKAHSLKPGEYFFTSPISLKQIIENIAQGRRVKRYFTVVPGTTIREVIKNLNNALGFKGSILSFPAEGSILPETYVYYYGDYRDQFLKQMQKSFVQIVLKLWQQRSRDSPLKSYQDLIIMASIVEKETAISKERSHIAAVFLNRLRMGMLLQSDPTVVYGLTLGETKLARPLTYADLKKLTTYNTYVIKGLPPAPISIPSLESLKATLQPLESIDLYFVADGQGGHVFAKTFKDHTANVAKWRHFQKMKEAFLSKKQK